MKIAVFGGTGMTGQCAVRHALSRGLQVKLLVRNESTVPDDFKGKVELVKGDVMNLEDVKRAVDGVDSVAVILGTRNDLGPTTVLSKGTENVIAAMKETGVRRVSVCVSAFQFRKVDEIPGIFREHSKDHQRQLDLLKESGLEYRAVLPPHISNEPASEYEVAYDRSPGRSISKHSLGEFLIDCLDVDEHKGKVLGLATTKTTWILRMYRIFNTIKAIPVFLRIFLQHKFRPIKNE